MTRGSMLDRFPGSRWEADACSNQSQDGSGIEFFVQMEHGCVSLLQTKVNDFNDARNTTSL